MAYDLAEHRHRFAVWAAARASQRGFATVRQLRKALEATRIREVLADPQTPQLSVRQFEKLHRRWCRSICAHLTRNGVAHVSFGRAAKLVAVYLKASVIMGDGCASSFGRNLHPPVDRILLRALSRSTALTSPHKKAWRSIKWTQLNERNYHKLIGQLRGAMPKGAPLWTLEEYWEPSDSA